MRLGAEAQQNPRTNKSEVGLFGTEFQKYESKTKQLMENKQTQPKRDPKSQLVSERVVFLHKNTHRLSTTVDTANKEFTNISPIVFPIS